MARTTIIAFLLTLTGGAFAWGTLAPQEMPTPTRQHNKILESVGVWEGTLTMTMPGMEAEPTPAKETIEAIGGFWIQSRFECDFDGMPFVGTGCTGYDAQAKKYVGTWIDSMTSHLSVMEGQMSEDGKTLHMAWKAPDMTGQMADYRFEHVVKGDHYTTTFFMGDTQTMVIDMQRKAKTAEAAAKK